MDQKTIILASDHAGYALKEAVKAYLRKEGLPLKDLGTNSDESVNWVEYGARGAEMVSQDPDKYSAVLICGTGLGMSMVANKFRNVRAALCHNEKTAEMSRKHNNANVLILGGRILKTDLAIRLLKIWLTSPFEGGRHQQRLLHLQTAVEEKNFK